MTAILPLLYAGELERAAATIDEHLAAHGDAWSDKAHMLNAIAHALRGEHARAVGAWRRFVPTLNAEVPTLNHDKHGYGTLIAWSMLQAGQTADALRVLDQVETLIADRPRFGPESSGLVNVEIATLRGDYDLAMRRFEQAIADGFRQRLANGFALDNYPLFEPLSERDDFKRAVATIDQYHRNFL